MQHFFLRPTAIPLEQKLTQNPPESPLRALLAHTKSPNSLIYARKKVRDLNGKGVALVRVLVASDEKCYDIAMLFVLKQLR